MEDNSFTAANLLVSVFIFSHFGFKSSTVLLASSYKLIDYDIRTFGEPKLATMGLNLEGDMVCNPVFSWSEIFLLPYIEEIVANENDIDNLFSSTSSFNS